MDIFALFFRELILDPRVYPRAKVHQASQGASYHLGNKVVFVEIERGTNSDISTLKQLHGRGSALLNSSNDNQIATNE